MQGNVHVPRATQVVWMFWYLGKHQDDNVSRLCPIAPQAYELGLRQ